MENNEEYSDMVVAKLIEFIKQNELKEMNYKTPNEIETKLFQLFDQHEIASFGDGIGYYYVLLEDNRLLVILYNMGCSLPTEFMFKLYDAADKLIVKTIRQHEKGFSYLQIVDSDNNVIEGPYYSPEFQDTDINKPLKELMKSLSIEQIIENAKKPVTK